MDEIKTKRRPSWGIYLLLSLLVASVVSIVFGNLSVQQINDELYMTELVERQQFIPFYKWFNGTVEVENPRLDEPIAELNNHTLREVFEGGNLIGPTNTLVGWVAYNNAIISVENDYIKIVGNMTLPETGIRKANIVIPIGHYFYTVFDMKVADTTNADRIRQYRPPFKDYLLNNVDNEWHTYSHTLLNDIQVTANAYFNVIYDNETYALGATHYIRNTYQIDLGTFGISLTVDMNYYYNLYKQYKNYTDIPIYDASAYGVTPQQIEYYYNQYLNYVETMDLQDVYLVYTNPQYNTEIGTTFVVQYQNVTKSVLDTIDNLKGVYEGFKNTLDKIGDFFS